MKLLQARNLANLTANVEEIMHFMKRNMKLARKKKKNYIWKIMLMKVKISFRNEKGYKNEEN